MRRLIKEFRVLLFCHCGHEHAEHNFSEGHCIPLCPCAKWRGKRIEVA